MNVSKWSMSVLLAVACLFIATPVWAAKKMETSTACKKKKWSQKRFSHRLFSGMLKKYVRNGLVNYNGFRKKRRKLDKYLCRLAHTNVKKIRSRKARFAFWINAYNAITIRAILDRFPRSRGGQKSFSVVKKKWNFWKGSKYEVSGKWYTLDQIENGLIRPRFKDARLHFALVCGARGCPHLASRSYTGSRLSRMLTKNTRKYLASSAGFKLDRGAKTVHVSKLFQWYRKDFEQKHKHYLLFIAKFLKKSDRKFVRKHYKELKVKWIHYSWALNLQ